MTENQRKWAIEEIETNILPDACDEVAERALGYAIEALSHERPKGRWVCLEAEIGYYACSECDHRILRAKCNYCPNCGADMAELPNCGADMRGEEE